MGSTANPQAPREGRCAPAWTLASLAALGVTAFLLGALATAWFTHSLGAIRLDREVTGTVTLVNEEGSSLCLNEDRGGTQFCSELLSRPNDAAPRVGQHVTGTIVWVPISNGSAEAFIITSGQ